VKGVGSDCADAVCGERNGAGERVLARPAVYDPRAEGWIRSTSHPVHAETPVEKLTVMIAANFALVLWARTSEKLTV
jgi:hypothetical protein